MLVGDEVFRTIIYVITNRVTVDARTNFPINNDANYPIFENVHKMKHVLVTYVKTKLLVLLENEK